MHATPAAKGPWHSAFFNNGYLLALTILVVLVAGLSALSSLPRLEDPRIDTRNVLILSSYPGASAERVEALVSDVIEDELRQLFEIKEIKSTSRAGIAVLTVELQDWVDGQVNEQIFSKIRDRLGAAHQRFPRGAQAPILDEKRGATSFTLLVAMTSPEGYNTPISILSRMSEEVADRLRNVPGTELVRVFGQLQEEITVSADPQKLASAGLTIAQVSQAIDQADPKAPAGVVRTVQQNIRLQVSQGLSSLQAIRDIPIATRGASQFLRVGDVAEVSRGWLSPQQDIALVQGQQTVFVAARMQPTLRADTWTSNTLEAIDNFNELYQGSTIAEVIFEQNQYTESRLQALTENLLLGCIVVMLVVLIFMGARSAWIVGLSLPMSAAFTLFSLSFFDEQIHQMSVFGIIIAIGLLIDNAIVVTDEIRANLLLPGMSRLEAMNKAVQHLFSPLLASTLTTILGFMPIFLLPGNIGDFIGSIAISVVMALIGSLFISLTVIAALAAKFLPVGSQQISRSRWYKGGIDTPVISAWYRRFITRHIQRPWLAVVTTVSIPIAGFMLAGQLGNVFFPSADRDQFEVYLWMPNGTSIEQTKRLTLSIDAQIKTHPEVEQINWLIGGSVPSIYYNQVMTRDNTPHYANAVVKTYSVDQAMALIGTLQHTLDSQFPQGQIVVRAFGQGPPISAPIGVEIFGPDLHTIYDLGQQVRLAMSQIPGVVQSTASVTMGEPELQLAVSRDMSSITNMPLRALSAELQAALDGQLGGSILEGTEEIPIRVRAAPQFRSDVASMQSLSLVPPQLAVNNTWVPVDALGDLSLRSSIASITRKNGERVNIIEGFLLPNATAVDAGIALQAKLDEIGFELPKGYRIKLAGDADEQQEALGLLATYLPVLLVLMLTTLILTFRSVKLAGLIGSVALLAVGLGMLSLWISGLPIGFNPLLGCAGLIGVAINGSIVVIAAIRSNPLASKGDIEQIVSETMSCSRHILSTTFTTIGGFVPLLVFSEGSFWPPLAVVLAGGVGFSVILSLLFTPVVAGRLAIRAGKATTNFVTK